MEKPSNINRLAIVSFISGIIALLSIIFLFIAYNSQGIPSVGIGITDGIVIPVRNICVGVAILTGILSLREIKKKEGAEKGKLLAWFGIVLGVGWIIFGSLVGAAFLLSEILH